MTISRTNIYFIAGVGMIVGAFFAGAKAIGAVCALLYFVTSTDFSNTDPSITENIANAIFANQTTELVHGIGSFLILFLGGRWMLRGPNLLNRWADIDKANKVNSP